MKMKLLFFFLLVSCTHLFYQPTRYLYLDPKQLQISYEDIYFKAPNGKTLHGWFFKNRTKETKGTIVQFHGNAQNLSSHFFSLVWLIDEGYNLFTFDYEGYGLSEGEPTQKTVHGDALAALAKGREFWGKNGKGKFIIYGQSLGGAVLQRALVDYPETSKIDLVVLDSTFSSYKRVANSLLASHWISFFFSPLAYVLVSNEYAPYPYLKELKRPVLVIVGKKDTVVAEKLGKEIYQTVGSDQKWLWEIPEGTHINVFFESNGKYRKEFINLVDVLNQN